MGLYDGLYFAKSGICCHFWRNINSHNSPNLLILTTFGEIYIFPLWRQGQAEKKKKNYWRT